MTLGKRKSPSFARLSAECEHFVFTILENSGYLLSASAGLELEEWIDEVETLLSEQEDTGDTASRMLHKVKAVKRMLGKLHETLATPTPIDLDPQLCHRTAEGTLSDDELKAIVKGHAPGGDYYHYSNMRSVIFRKLRGEIDDTYFSLWLGAMCQLLNAEKYEPIRCHLESLGAKNEYSRSRLMECLALLKDFDYKLTHKDYLRQHKKDALKVIYLRHTTFNATQNSIVYKAYFVDYKSKRYDIRMLDDAFFEYDDNLLYCDIWSSHFDEDGEYIDTEHYGEEPALLEEEKTLLALFDQGWIYDHDLTF